MATARIEDYKKYASGSLGNTQRTPVQRNSVTQTGGINTPINNNPTTTNNDTITAYSNAASSMNSRNDMTNEYYQLAKDQQFTVLLDKEIQLENARAYALKNTNAMMQSQGMASQGYGSSMNAGIGNQYINAYQNLQQGYQDTIQGLDQAQRQEIMNNDNDLFDSVTDMIDKGGDIGNINEMLANYGYGSVDSSDNFVFGNKPENMSKEDWYQLQYIYNAKKLDLEKQNTEQDTYAGAYYGSKEDLLSGTFTDRNGNITKFDSDAGGKHVGFRDEIELLFTNQQSGNYKYGDVIQMTNSAGDTVYLELTQNGFRQVNEEAYNNSGGKHVIDKWAKKETTTQTTQTAQTAGGGTTIRMR